VDVLGAETKTTGIYETRFAVDQLTIRLFDVSGQQSEWKKCAYQFKHVISIIYVVNLAEYDQGGREELSQNRMMESLVLRLHSKLALVHASLGHPLSRQRFCV